MLRVHEGGLVEEVTGNAVGVLGAEGGGGVEVQRGDFIDGGVVEVEGVEVAALHEVRRAPVAVAIPRRGDGRARAVVVRAIVMGAVVVGVAGARGHSAVILQLGGMVAIDLHDAVRCRARRTWARCDVSVNGRGGRAASGEGGQSAAPRGVGSDRIRQVVSASPMSVRSINKVRSKTRNGAATPAF